MANENVNEEKSSSLIKTQGLWFRDGTIVLKANNHVFKVYQGILAAHCQVFEDLFTCAKPDGSNSLSELFEDCPMVEMQDDPFDLKAFLSSIFDQNYFPPPPLKISIQTAFRVLRLAHKYQSDELKLRALRHISPLFPTALTEYDRLNQSALTATHLFGAIRVIREVGAFWLLPYALYKLVPSCSNELALREESFSFKDRLGIINFKVQAPTLKGFLLDFLAPMGPQDLEGCETPSKCKHARHVTLYHANELSYGSGEFNTNPLDCWHYQYENKQLHKTFQTRACSRCKNICLKALQKGRNAIWDALPRLFGVSDTWEELTKLKLECMRSLTAKRLTSK